MDQDEILRRYSLVVLFQGDNMGDVLRAVDAFRESTHEEVREAVRLISKGLLAYADENDLRADGEEHEVSGGHGSYTVLTVRDEGPARTHQQFLRLREEHLQRRRQRLLEKLEAARRSSASSAPPAASSSSTPSTQQEEGS